jgi:hypothetical protein
MEAGSMIAASILSLALARLAASAEPAHAPASLSLPRVPFEFVLTPEEQSAFVDPGPFDGSGVEARIRWSGSPGSERVDVLQEREGAGWPRWKWTDARMADDGSSVLAALPGARTIVIWRRAGDEEGRYRASSVFFWPAEARDLALERTSVRTLRGGDAPVGSPGTLRFAQASGGGDALCETDGGRRWQCVAVPHTPGAVVFCGEDGQRRSAAIDSSAWGDIRLEPSAWSAAIAVEDPDDPESGEPVSFTISFATGHRGQIRSSETVRADRFGENLYWVRGPLGPAARLVARRAGRVGTLAADELAAAPCDRPLRLALFEARAIRGRVRDASGAPLARASVLLLESGTAADAESRDDPHPPPAMSASTQTDENGIFAFPDAENGKWRIRACHARAGCADRVSAPSDGEIEIVLAQRWRFTGRLVSSTGVPQAQAHLRFLPTLEHYESARDRLLTLPPESDAESDPDGRFEIAPVGVGGYYLEARAARVGTARKPIEITEQTPGRTDLGDLVLSGAGEFLARVTLTQGGCPGGSLALAGPVGATSLPVIRDFPIDGRGLVRVELPEGGNWLVWGRCADGRRDVDPGLLANVESVYGGEVALTLAAPGADPETPRPPRP